MSYQNDNKNSETFIVKLDNTFGDVDNDGIVDLIVGGSLPGGAVISSVLSARPGNPIGGLTIKGGKKSGRTNVEQNNQQSRRI